MDNATLGRLIDYAKSEIHGFIGKQKCSDGEAPNLVLVPGTGTEHALNKIFRGTGVLPYPEISIPGADAYNAGVKGHHQSLRKGVIDGNELLVMGRIHPNEVKSPDISLANRVVLQAVKEILGENLDGIIIMQGVGTLHGPIGAEQGEEVSKKRTEKIDDLHWAVTGEEIAEKEIGVGDIGVVKKMLTRYIGTNTPLVKGEFRDARFEGYLRDEGRYLEFAKQVVTAEQDGRCPAINYAFLLGPQFESVEDKIWIRASGGDVIGMSGLTVLAATQLDVPFVQVVLATNGAFEKHDHDENQEEGRKQAPKLARIIRGLVADWPSRTTA